MRGGRAGVSRRGLFLSLSRRARAPGCGRARRALKPFSSSHSSPPPSLSLCLSLHPRQINPAKYPSIGAGFSITAAEGGMRGLVRGWVPTLFGYSIQGAAKFGLYGAFLFCF